MNNKVTRLAILFVLATLQVTFWGCEPASSISGPGNTVCTLEAVAGITIYMRDRATGLDVCGSTATIVDGEYREELQGISVADCSYPYNGLSGAWERAGVYALTVQTPGYADFVQSDIAVTENLCHVNPVTFDVYLEPL